MIRTVIMAGSILALTSGGPVLDLFETTEMKENNQRIVSIDSAYKAIEGELNVNKELLAVIESDKDEIQENISLATNKIKDEDKKQKELSDLIKKEKERIAIAKEEKRKKEEQAERERIQAEEKKKAQAQGQSYVAPPEQTGEVSYSQPAPGSGMLNTFDGVAYLNGVRETYYSQNVLAGGGLNIPGRHVGQWGTVRDADGYIVGASDVLSKGSTTMSTLGPVKIYDTGVGHNGLDLYTNW